MSIRIARYQILPGSLGPVFLGAFVVDFSVLHYARSCTRQEMRVTVLSDASKCALLQFVQAC